MFYDACYAVNIIVIDKDTYIFITNYSIRGPFIIFCGNKYTYKCMWIRNAPVIRVVDPWRYNVFPIPRQKIVCVY